MWFQVLGANGTGKNFVVEYLKRQHFELIPAQREILPNETWFQQELSHSQARLRAQLKASELRNRRDVVTINSFWDANEVFTKVARELEYISASEKAMLDLIYHTFEDPYSLVAPHAVIYTHTEKMTGLNRLKLKSVDIHQDYYNAQIQAFAEFVPRIKVPLIELDMNLDPAYAIQNLEFSINSLKASQITNSTIWHRSFFV